MKTAPIAAIGINLVFFLYHIPTSIEANETKRTIMPVVLSKNFIILSAKLSELSYIVFMLFRSAFEIVAAAIPTLLNPMRVVHKIMPIDYVSFYLDINRTTSCTNSNFIYLTMLYRFSFLFTITIHMNM